MCAALIDKFMANSPHLPSGNLQELRPGFPQDPANTRLRAVSPQPTVNHEEPPLNSSINGNLIGPRKLVRPKLPAGILRERSGPRGESPMLTHQTLAHHDDSASSHAEAFYFQKQVQTQTLMVFVLEDGQHVEGYIEWYDRNVIKVRNGGRTLIYKSAIKYLYKAGDINGSVDSFKKTR